MSDAAPADLAGADLQGLDGARPGRPRQLTAGREALAEPDDAGEGIHYAKSILRRSRDQQAAVVGAEVEGGIEAAVGAAPPRLPGRLAGALLPPEGATPPVPRGGTQP